MKLTKTMASLALGITLAFSASAANAGEALDRVMKAGVLKVATDPDWAPQSFINDDNKMDGFDVDVAKETAKRLGVKVEFVTPSWDIITAGNWSGRWDLSVGSMTPTKKRAEVLSFPGVYYYTPASIAVHKDSKYTTIAELNGKKIGASTASTYDLYLQKDLTIDAEGTPEFEYQLTAGEIKSYKNGTAALDDLRLGDGVRLDAMLGSLPSTQSAIESKYPLKVLGDPVFYEPLSLAIDKGDKEFNDKLAEIVTAMKEDGTLKALSLKWYKVDYSSVVE